MHINALWAAVAQRIAQGLWVLPGELVQVRCGIDRFEVLQEIMLAVELAGATPLAEIIPARYLERLVGGASRDYLENWDRHRQRWMGEYDRIITTQGDRANWGNLPAESLAAWQSATHRLTTLEESRFLPVLVVGVPTTGRATDLGMSLEELEEIVLPALAVSAEELQAEIGRVLKAAQGEHEFSLVTGDGQYTLHLKQGERPWLKDDGLIDEEDRARGAIVSNLPAGSIYTTVLEEETEGTLLVSEAAGIKEVVFHFEGGRIARIEASEGAEKVAAWLDSYSGEPRRVSHLGIGLNPLLRTPIGWTLVDEHVYGHIFLALGENRYMGGHNESSLNFDFAIPSATFKTGDRVLVSSGKVVPLP